MDVEPEAITFEDGSMTYYVLDFDGVATERLRTKLLNQHGSLRIEVSTHLGPILLSRTARERGS